jgi:hypothetical protein
LDEVVEEKLHAEVRDGAAEVDRREFSPRDFGFIERFAGDFDKLNLRGR